MQIEVAAMAVSVAPVSKRFMVFAVRELDSIWASRFNRVSLKYARSSSFAFSSGTSQSEKISVSLRNLSCVCVHCAATSSDAVAKLLAS